MTLNQCRRKGRWARVCRRSLCTQGRPQFRSKKVFVDMWAWACRHQWRRRERCFNTHQPSLVYSALCRHHQGGRSFPSSGETLGMDPLARRGNEEPPAGKRSPSSSAEAPGRGAGGDGGREASHCCRSPFPCQPCSICWQEQCGAEPPPDTAGRASLIFGSLLSHDFPSTLAPNTSSKLQIKYCACCVFTTGSAGWEGDFPAHLWSVKPNGNPLQGCTLGYWWEWRGDGSTSCCLSQVPRKPGCSCGRCSGEMGVLWLFALLLSTLLGYCFGLCLHFSLAY